MKRALLLIRDLPHYRRDAFVAGLTATGFSVVRELPNPAQGDAIVVWNRYGAFDSMARRFEAVGAKVWVAENGYMGRDELGHSLYSLHSKMLHGYGDDWYYGGDARWAALGVRLADWRHGDGAALIFEQRGIGVAPVRSDRAWAERMAALLRAELSCEVRIRRHPEDKTSKERVPPLERDLEGVAFCVTHTSAAGLHAMAMGVPVITTADRWLGRPAAAFIAENDRASWRNVNSLLLRSDELRTKTFQRLAWAQWTVKELASGKPFQFTCT